MCVVHESSEMSKAVYYNTIISHICDLRLTANGLPITVYGLLLLHNERRGGVFFGVELRALREIDVLPIRMQR